MNATVMPTVTPTVRSTVTPTLRSTARATARAMAGSTARSTAKPTVVAGIDGSAHSLDALIWAAEVAMSRGHRLEILHAVGQPMWGFDLELDRLIEQEGKSLLESRAEIVEHALPQLVLRTALSLDTPARAMVKASEDAELLVVGSDPLLRLDRAMTGSRSYQMAALARCPVAVVPGMPPMTAHGVVVAVDGSADGVAAVRLAAAEADRMATDLRVVHAWSDPLLMSDGYLMAGFAERVREQEEIALSESVAGIAERYPDLVVRQDLVKGRPADAILEAAEGARLIVVGSRGRRGLSRILLGSVSHAVVLGARCPVIVTRTTRRTKR